MRSVARYLYWVIFIETAVGPTYRYYRDLHLGADAGDVKDAYSLGTVYRNKGRFRRAGHYLRQAAEAGYPEAAAGVAEVLERKGREPEQREYWLLRAAQLAAASERPPITVAGYLRKAGQAEQADDVLRQAAESGDAQAADVLGSLMRESRSGEAERYYKIALELGHSSAALRLAELSISAGRQQEAEVYYRRAADQGNLTAVRWLARQALDAGDDPEAERYLRMAADHPGRAWQDVRTYIDFLRKRGRREAADQYLESIDLENRPDALYEKAEQLRRAGRSKEADECVARAELEEFRRADIDPW